MSLKDNWQKTKLTIHRGSHEIGGSCLELESGGKRIVVDVGKPLWLKENVAPKGEIGRDKVEELMGRGILPRVKGLYLGEERGVEAVLLSHAHQDHHGLMSFIHPEVPVWMSRGTRALLEASEIFVPGVRVPRIVNEAAEGRPFRVAEEFEITPVLMDHSAPDARGFIIEAGGKRIFYTGDFRATGRKGCFKKLLSNPPRNIDYLITEGTNLGRPPQGPRNEYEAEDKLAENLRVPGRLILVYTAAQNLDRVVSIFKASRRAGRTLVLDLYSAFVMEKLKVISNGHPNLDFENGVAVKFWNEDKKKLEAKGAIEFIEKAGAKRVDKMDILHAPGDFVMMGRSNSAMRNFLNWFDSPQHLKVIWSLWHGYLDDKPFIVDYCQENDVPFEEIHASGHATEVELKALAHSIKPGALIPVHCEEPELFKKIYPSVIPAKDGVPVPL